MGVSERKGLLGSVVDGKTDETTHPVFLGQGKMERVKAKKV